MKKFLAILTIIAGLFIAPIVVKAWSQPTGSLNVEIKNSSTYQVRAYGNYSQAYDWNSILTWGDGQSVAFPNESGNYDVTHNYANAGTYYIALTVKGGGGTTTDYYWVNFSKTVSGSMNVVISDPSQREVKADISYDSSNDWGTTVYWGHDNSFVTLPKTSGSYSLYHKYPHDGLFKIDFVAEGIGGPVVIEKEVNFTQELPSVSASMDVAVTNPSERAIQATGSYNNSYDWGTTVYWGHDNLFITMPGTSTGYSQYHQFPTAGTYKVSLVAEGNNGPIVINKDITVDGLANPAQGNLNIEVVDAGKREIKVTGSYANSYDWGTTIYWGHDNLFVRYPNNSGNFAESHQFPTGGTFKVTLVVEGTTGPLIVDKYINFN